MAADVPFTGHETLDDILRRYIVLLALANGALLAGASFLGQAGNLLWIAVVILAAPFWALQLIVLHVTSGHLGMPFPWSLFDKDRKEDIGEW